MRPGWVLGGPGHIPYVPLPSSLHVSGAHTHPPKGLHSRGPSLASFWEPLLAYLPRLPLPKHAELQLARPGTMLRAFALGTAFTPFLQMGKQAWVVELVLNPPVLSLTLPGTQTLLAPPLPSPASLSNSLGPAPAADVLSWPPVLWAQRDLTRGPHW